MILTSATTALPADKAGSLVPRDCSSQIASFNLARRERRGHTKRASDTNLQAVSRPRPRGLQGTDNVKQLSCVAAPETPLGMYINLFFQIQSSHVEEI